MRNAETIQYHHNTHDGFTVALNVDITRQDLEDLVFKPVPHIVLDVGIAYKHHKDHYNHETGRTKAWSAMKKVDFILNRIEVDQKTHKLMYWLESREQFKEGPTRILLRTSLKSNKPHLIMGYNTKAMYRNYFYETGEAF